jgi:peptidoglycan hydrolase-like protein with peptidoglycan-binding domain
MRDVLEEEGRRLSLPSIAALLAAALVSAAISCNALFGQQAHAPRAAKASGDTRVDVEAPAANTVTLKYDPAIETIQRALQQAGFYNGPVDGVAGKQTKNAIAAYQSASGLPATGEATPDLVDQIRYSIELAKAAEFTGAVSQPVEAADAKSVRLVQTGLSELGYAPGEVTGELDAQTQAAIAAFEKDRGLPETGAVSDALLAELSKTSGKSSLTPQ